MVSVDCQQLEEILRLTPASQNILLVGRHGIGKSEILRAHYESRGEHVVPLFLGQMADPGDLIGLPSAEGEVMTFRPPYWWPVDGRPVVLFLDELNRARPELLQTVMDLCLSRTLAGRCLPEGSRVIAAVNDGEQYQLTPLDPALVSRFAVYRFVPTVADWLRYAQARHLDERVVRFITENPTWLDGDNRAEDTGLEPMPDRRAWTLLAETIAPLRELTEQHAPLLSGRVGTAAASRFLHSLSGEHLVSPEDVLLRFPRYEATIRLYRLHEMSALTESVFRHFDLSQDPAYAAGLTAFVRLLVEREDREQLAYMANLFCSGSYPAAVVFITTHCPEVYRTLLDYVATL